MVERCARSMPGPGWVLPACVGVVAALVFGVSAQPSAFAQETDARSHLACDGVRDDRAALAALVGPGGLAAGGTLRIPAGCRVLLSSPGAGAAAVTLAGGTRVVCDDRERTTFLLATRACDDGPFAGSVCDDSTSCRSGACRCLPASGSATARDRTTEPPTDAARDPAGDEACRFALQTGATTTVVAAGEGAAGVAVVGCRFDVGQVEPFARCRGGPQEGWPCAVPADCAPEGECSADPRSPSGSGQVRVVDFERAAGARIENVTVVNVRDADAVLAVGAGGVVERCRVGEAVVKASGVAPSTRIGDQIRVGAKGVAAENLLGRGRVAISLTGPGASARDNVVAGADVGVQGAAESTVRGGAIRVTERGSGVLVGAGSSVAGVRVSFGEVGIRVEDSGEVRGCTVRGNATAIVAGFGSRIEDNELAGYRRVGIQSTGGASIRGNRLTTTHVRDGLVPTSGIALAGLQTIVANNILSSAGFLPLHGIDDVMPAFNVLVQGNRFVHANGPAVVTSGAGWQVIGNYINETARGYCADPTAARYLEPCSCMGRQCDGGDPRTAGIICTDDSTCGTGRCIENGPEENPYGGFGPRAQGCRAVGSARNTCDADPARARCESAPAVLIGLGDFAPTDVLSHGARIGSDHVSLADNIIARGLEGPGQTSVRLAAGGLCNGEFTSTCRGVGGNAGKKCKSDADCTSTGCRWGDGHCCALAGRACSHARDCDDPNDEKAACLPLIHHDLSINDNFFYPEWQAIDASLTGGGRITGMLISGNTISTGKSGILLPSDPAAASDLLIEGNRIATTLPGRRLENFTPSMGRVVGNSGIADGVVPTASSGGAVALLSTGARRATERPRAARYLALGVIDPGEGARDLGAAAVRLPAGTLSALRCVADRAPGAGRRRELRVLADGEPTELVCPLADTEAECAASGLVALPAGGARVVVEMRNGDAPPAPTSLTCFLAYAPG